MNADLRESGNLEQDSDVIMFLQREELYNPKTERLGSADLFVTKNRHGAIGDMELRFHAESTRFDNADCSDFDTVLSGME